MNWEALGAIAELLGAVGVIATLAFLAIQIRQNTRATRAAAFDTILAEFRTHQRDSFISNPDAMRAFIGGCVDIDALSKDDQRLFTNVAAQEALYLENIIQQYQNGNIDYDQLRPWLDYFSGVIRTPGATKWWVVHSPWFSPNLQNVVNQHILETDGQPTILDHRYLAPDLPSK